MAFGNILSATDISASGLAAERQRMEVVANNIANANTTRAENGEPFRRRDVVFASVYDNALGLPSLGQGKVGGGVRVAGIEPDMSEFSKVYRPGHPDADADGYLSMPNINVPVEMVDMITAGRAYEANLKALRAFRQMVEQALSILRGA